MSERSRFIQQPARKMPNAPSSSGLSWKERLAGAALVAGTLGGAYHHFSDDHHQDALNASVPDRGELGRREAARSRAEGSSGAEQHRGPGSREVWDRLNQAWQEETEENMAAAEEAPAPVHERSAFEIAHETGRDILFEMMQSGEYQRYLGHPGEFNTEVMRRIAEAYGIPFDPHDTNRQPYIAARNAIREELMSHSQNSLERAQAARELGRSPDRDLEEAIQARSLGFAPDGVRLAIMNGRGDLAVNSLHQSGYDLHDPMNSSMWDEIAKPYPEEAEAALTDTWRYLSNDDRASIQSRIEYHLRMAERNASYNQQRLSRATDEIDQQITRQRLAHDQADIADFRRILQHWF